jgi:hypothetical protein
MSGAFSRTTENIVGSHAQAPNASNAVESDPGNSESADVPQFKHTDENPLSGLEYKGVAFRYRQVQREAGPMKAKDRTRPALIRFAILALLTLGIGGKWYVYVAHADSPFDNVGSGLNALMPGPINKVGCDMLRQRFGNLPIPPRGCEAAGRWS